MLIPTITARQWFGKHVPMAMNTLATMKELLEPSFSMLMMYQRKVSNYFFLFLIRCQLFIKLGMNIMPLEAFQYDVNSST
jgi:hypothetical protein